MTETPPPPQPDNNEEFDFDLLPMAELVELPDLPFEVKEYNPHAAVESSQQQAGQPSPQPATKPRKKMGKLAKWVLSSGLSLGTLGTLSTTVYLENGNVAQECNISHIPVKDGKVTVGVDSFLGQVFEKNNHIVFGDTDHTAEEIPLFIAAHVRDLKAAGVNAIFIELDRKHQDTRDNYLRGRFSYQMLETYDYLNRQCKEHGIDVVLMDVDFKSDEAKDAYTRYSECMRKYKEQGIGFSNTEEYLGPGCGAFLREREEANHAWVELIKQKGYNKTVTLCGTHHTTNPHWFEPDTDELVAQLGGGCVYINLRPTTGAKDVSILRERRWNPVQEQPEFTIRMARLPEDVKKALNYDLFRHLAGRGEFDGLMSAPESTRAFVKMPWYEYVAMKEGGDHGYADYHQLCRYNEFREFNKNSKLDWLNDSPRGKALLGAYRNLEHLDYCLKNPHLNMIGMDKEAATSIKAEFWKANFIEVAQKMEKFNHESKRKHDEYQKRNPLFYGGSPTVQPSDLARIRWLALQEEKEPELARVIELTNDNSTLMPLIFHLGRPEEMRKQIEVSEKLGEQWKVACNCLQDAVYSKDMLVADAQLVIMKQIGVDIKKQPKDMLECANMKCLEALPEIEKQVEAYKRKKVRPENPAGMAGGKGGRSL
jgi:hypothetical protein